MALSARGSTSEQGFSVVEGLIALAILAVAAGLMQQGLSQLGTGGSRAAHHLEALRIAESELATAGIASPLTAGVRQGLAPGGYSWRLTARPAARSGEEGGYLSGYWTTAEVFWRETGESTPRSVSLTTLKIVRAEAPR